MFDKKIFYMLAAVKIYGIKDTERKAQRYAIYTEQFAKAIEGSEHSAEIQQMAISSMKKLASQCFEEGKATESAIYFIMLLKSLEKHNIQTGGLWEEQDEKEEVSEEQERSMCMLKTAAGIKDGCSLSQQDNSEVDEFVEMIEGCV
jgi:hypothetical protein